MGPGGATAVDGPPWRCSTLSSCPGTARSDIVMWPTIDEFLNPKKKPRKVTTREQYERNLDRFFEAADAKTEKQALALDVDQAIKARNWLVDEEGLKESSVRAIFATARSYYNFLVKKKRKLKDNPLVGVDFDLDAPEVPLWNSLKDGEQKKVFKTIKGNNRVRDKAIFLGLLHHAWRASELCGLVWDKFEKRGDRYGFRYETKGHGKREAWQAVEEEFLVAAKKWSPKKAGWPVIPRHRRDSTPLTRFDVHRIVTKWTGRALGRKVTPHGLRATKITQIAEEYGKDAARDFVGHADIKTTERYIRDDVEIRGLPSKRKKKDDD